MIKNKYITSIIALSLSLFIVCGFDAIYAADPVSNTYPIIMNAGGITLSGFSMNGSDITVSGCYSGSDDDIISYLVYEKDNKNNLITIGETTSINGALEIVFGIDTTKAPQTLTFEMKSEKQDEKATAEISMSDCGLRLSNRLAGVKNLLERCEEQGIETDYERVKYATAAQVESMLDGYLQNKETEAYTFNAQKALELLSEAENTLNSYLNGTAQPLLSRRTVTGVPSVDGQSFLARTEDCSDKPIFYVGYGHWDTSDMERYKDLGVNYIQYEIGVNNVMKRGCPAQSWELDDVNTAGTPNGHKYTMLYSGGALQLDSSGSGEVYVSQTVAVKPSTTYTFGIDFKCQSASSIWIKADGSSEAKKWIYDSNYDSSVPNWKSVSHTVTTGTEQTQLTFTIGSHNNAVQLMYDNAYLKESGSGTNLLQNGDFSVECTDKFAVRKEALSEIKSVFERAEQSDVGVVFLLCMHYFPQFVYELDPTVRISDKHIDFMPFNPTHPLVKETLTEFINAVIPAVKDYKSLNSICLSNEPAFYANVTPEYYLSQYREYLQEKYTTITELNSAYHTAYTSFDMVNMPENTRGDSNDRKNIVYFNDYRLFNESIMTEYHKMLVDAVKAVDGNLLLHTKQMTPMNAIGNSSNRIEAGINSEKLAQLLDLNGCDAWAYYGSNVDTLLSKTMWYDYLTSVKNAPVVNSEDHILVDYLTELTRNEAEFKMNMADVWQGAVHGRGGTVLWLWDKGANSKGGTVHYNTNITRRADYIAGIGKISLDLNRLSDEVTAIQRVKPRVAVLYSDSSLAQNLYAMQAGYIAYEKALYHGEKVFFVTEEQPEQLNANKDLKLLIVPCSNYMKAETLNQIKQFIDGGGKVLLLNAENKQWRNENGGAHDATLLNSVISRCETVEFSKKNDMEVTDRTGVVNEKLDEVLESLGSRDITLSADCGGIEWTAAQYGNDYIINICNHGTEAAQIVLNAPAQYDIASAIDMISSRKTGSSFIVQPNEPILLKLENRCHMKFYDSSGNETEKITTGAMSATVEYYAGDKEKSLTHIVAIYKEKRLEKLLFQSTAANENGSETSQIDFEIDTDDDLSKYTVKSFLFDSFTGLTPMLPAKEIRK